MQPAGTSVAAHVGSLDILSPDALSDILAQLGCPLASWEPGVEALLNSAVSAFVDTLLEQAVVLAKHREGETLEVRDALLAAEKLWGLRVPGHSLLESTQLAAQAARIKLIAKNAELARSAPASVAVPAGASFAQRADMVARAQTHAFETAAVRAAAAAAKTESITVAQNAALARPMLSLGGSSTAAAAAATPAASTTGTSTSTAATRGKRKAQDT